MGTGGKAFAGLILLALALPGAGQAADPAPAPADPGADPANLILRLTDLSRAYRLGNDGYCSELFYYEEGRDPELLRLDGAHPSRTCELDFRNRGYDLWGKPSGIVSNTTVFERADSAVTAFDTLIRTRPRSLKQSAAPPLGDESAFYTVRPPDPNAESVLVWRTGRVLSHISADGLSKRWVREHVLRLARLQQARIVSPTVVAPRDNARRSLPVVAPGIDVPFYWLGRSFEGRGLPERRLDFAERADDPCCGPAWTATADYGYISLGTWTNAGWRRFRQSRVGRLVFDGDRCGQVTRLRLHDRRAVILSRRVKPDFSHYPRIQRRFTQLWKRCDDKTWPPIHRMNVAYVRFRGAVVSINVPQCAHCINGTRDRYDSIEGMRAIVRGLRLKSP